MNSPVSQDIQIFQQRLDAANKKIDDHTELIASLYAELKHYRNTICVACKEKLLAASVPTTSSQVTSTVSQDTATTLGNLCDPAGTDITPDSPDRELPFYPPITITESQPSSPLALSFRSHGSNSSIEDSQTESDTSSHTASRTLPSPSNTIPNLPLSPASTLPVAPVLYNPEIDQALELSLVKSFELPADANCVKFSRDGEYFSVALRNEETHIYDMLTMSSKSVLVDNGTLVICSEAAAAAASKDPSSLWTVRFSPDGKYIATGGNNPRIKIWEIKRKRICAIFDGHTNLVTCIDFWPDGRFLASASYDDTVRIWRIRDGSSKCLCDSISSDFNSVAFSPDGRYIAAGNDDGHLRLWDARSHHLLKKWEGHADLVRSVAFRPDGRGMASAGDDRTWKSWDVSQLRSSGQVEQECTCERHTGTVSSISFSPDSRWVVTSSYDRTLRIWEATTGVWVCTLVGHTSPVWGSDFSPAGQYLVTGGEDDQVLLWRYRGVDE